MIISSVSFGLSAVCGTCCPEGVPSRPTPKATGPNLRKGIAACLGAVGEECRCWAIPTSRFAGGGDISEDGWRAAARVRLAFLLQTLLPAKLVKAAAEDAFAG